MKFRSAIAALLLIASVQLANAGDTPNELDSMIDDLLTPVTKQVDESNELVGSMPSSRLDDIERRLEELERTSIDAKEAEEIAERVVQRHVKELRLSINKPEGGQRIATVHFDSPTSIQQFQLGPGESLASYCDVQTGQTVVVGEPTSTVTSRSYSQPVPTWTTSEVVIQTQPAPVQVSRTVAVRPVVQTYSSSSTQTYRRGLFGRKIPVASSSGKTCRMVNGVQVCN